MPGTKENSCNNISIIMSTQIQQHSFSMGVQTFAPHTLFWMGAAV